MFLHPVKIGFKSDSNTTINSRKKKQTPSPDSLDGKKDNRGKCTVHHLNSNMQNKQQLSRVVLKTKGVIT